MKTRRSVLVTLCLAAVLMISLSGGCGSPESGGGPANAPGGNAIQLDGVEIHDYKGEKLGSVNDFRENSIKGSQHVDRESYRLQVGGLVRRKAAYSYSEITSSQPAYEKVVQLDCVEGWSVKVLWRGVRVRDLIEKAGALPNANTVIFTAADGYTTSLPLSYLTDNDILLAYRMNGVTLPEVRGFPLQLVAEDKWGYKWVKWIVAIELSDDPAYRGYWESRGYSNSGDLNKSFTGN